MVARQLFPVQRLDIEDSFATELPDDSGYMDVTIDVDDEPLNDDDAEWAEQPDETMEDPSLADSKDMKR